VSLLPGIDLGQLALGSPALSIAPERRRGVDARERTWFDQTMSKHYSINLGSMISGIQRWVETESPTRDKAAVNRMVDAVQSDVAGLPVAVERVAGRDGFADNLVVRNQGAGQAAGILILSHIDTVHPIGTWRARCHSGAMATACMGPACST
jgi:hypothetical protein